MNPNPLMLLLVAFVPVLAFKSTRGVRATDNKDDVAYDMMFPEDFIFSSATASYQVEGGWNASGKGENIWDHLVHERPSAVLDKSNGDVACDSYHKYEEDIRLAKELGTKMYRFSLSWSRLLPTGAIDIINTDGVRYYHALLDEIIANGITPMVTLYHWDLPQPLQDLGGFTTEAFVNYFVDFAEFVFKTFGNKVEYWITFNEPSAVCSGGYASGSKAPQILSPARGEYLCAHNLLKAHAKAYRLYQRSFKSEQKGRIGLATYIDAMWPKDPTNTEDVEAVNRWYQFSLGWFTHPIFSEEGDYPAVMKQRILAASVAQGLKRSRLPQFTTEEINELRGSADFFGLNHYTSTAVANLKATDVQTDEGTRKADAGLLTSALPEWESTLAPWHRVVPEGLRKLLNYIKDEYNNPPLIITENGYPDSGGLKDVNRTRYFRLYLLEILKAIHLDGCKVFGYTAWSLMDNFEWLEGYVYRFGLHAVDFADPTRPRTPRMSAKFFQQLTATRRVPREDEIVYPDDSTATPSAATSTPSARATAALAALVSVVIVAVQSGLPAAAVTRTIH